MRLKGLQDIYETERPVATVYFEAGVPTEDAADKTELRIRALVEQLDAAGAPEPLCRTVEELLAEPRPGAQQRDGRALVADESGALLDDTYTGADEGDRAHWGRPALGAYLRERARTVRLLTVLADATGAVLQECAVVESGDTAVTAGPDLPMHQPRGAAPAHTRIRRRVDEAVRHNAKDVAAQIGTRVSKTRPAAVVLAGDVNARTAIRHHLTAAPSILLTEIDHELDEQALGMVAADLVEQREAALVERWYEALAHHTAAQGGADVARAAELGAVETLLLAETSDEHAALVHACAGTDAALEHLPDRIAVTDGVGALLRFPPPQR